MLPASVGAMLREFGLENTLDCKLIETRYQRITVANDGFAEYHIASIAKGIFG